MPDPNVERTRNEDLKRVAGEVTNRLAGLGISLSGNESPGDLVRIQEAVERFEVAVRSRGGDLMVDEGPGGRTTAPDDPHFALPRRNADEPVDTFVNRLAVATDDVLRHEPKP